jgi:hypothetical protein
MSAAIGPLLEIEEEGISYFYYNEPSSGSTSAEQTTTPCKPYFIGTKRFAGLYCRACERPLAFGDEKQSKVQRAFRKADKNDENILSECTHCSAKVGDKKKTVVPCASFDWHMPPHALERLRSTTAEPQPSAGKKKSATGNDDDTGAGNDDGSDEGPADDANKSKQKRSYKEALLRIEAERPRAIRSTLTPPHLSRGGHIENQYGHIISLEDFFTCVVGPCPVRCYERIPKHCV